MIFLAVAGNLTNTLAEALRQQFAKTKAVAEQLAEANRNLQQAEEAVRRSDRLAALGQLAAGLAHELRNPLGTIRASAEMLTRSVAAENEVAREVAGFIAEEVDRTNSLVTRFLDFVRPLELRRAPADLAQVLDRSVAMVEREAAAREVTVYKNYSPDIPPFPLDAELMERVFYNLLAERRASHGSRRRGHGEDAPGWRERRDFGDRPRRRHRSEADRHHLQSLLHHQAGWRGSGAWPSAPRSWTSTAARSRSRASRARAASSACICPWWRPHPARNRTT